MKNHIKEFIEQLPSEYHEFEKIILELQAKLNKLRWIPVSEGLPKIGQEVLLCNKNKTVLLTMWTIQSIKYLKFTHWKPIILPDKE